MYTEPTVIAYFVSEIKASMSSLAKKLIVYRAFILYVGLFAFSIIYLFIYLAFIPLMALPIFIMFLFSLLLTKFTAAVQVPQETG